MSSRDEASKSHTQSLEEPKFSMSRCSGVMFCEWEALKIPCAPFAKHDKPFLLARLFLPSLANLIYFSIQKEARVLCSSKSSVALVQILVSVYRLPDTMLKAPSFGGSTQIPTTMLRNAETSVRGIEFPGAMDVPRWHGSRTSCLHPDFIRVPSHPVTGDAAVP